MAPEPLFTSLTPIVLAANDVRTIVTSLRPRFGAPTRRDSTVEMERIEMVGVRQA